jgi:hypothetical protein
VRSPDYLSGVRFILPVVIFTNPAIADFAVRLTIVRVPAGQPVESCLLLRYRFLIHSGLPSMICL